ncbi:MAG: ABC transporter permease [Acidimicrobiales bacterium]
MRGLAATMRNAFAELRANRAAFVSQAVVMGVNDVVWVVFWLLFFRRVGSVRGWDADSILLLLAVITSAAGIALGVLANARRVGNMAVDGELDAVLALPVPPLAHLLLRRIEASNVGDLGFGLVLFAFTGNHSVGRTAVFVAVVLAAATLMTGFLVMTGSLAFFLGRNEGGELGFHALVLLGSYPVDVFAGAIKVVLYTVVPAAFVSSVPARLVEDFDLLQAAVLVAVSATFAVGAWATFTIGLRRYTSGSVWTRA